MNRRHMHYPICNGCIRPTEERRSKITMSTRYQAHEAMRCARCKKSRPNYWVAVPQ